MKKKNIADFFNKRLVESKRIIIYFHGNAASRAVSYRVETAKQLASVLEANVVLVDYRGFGDSEGWPSEEGTKKDARAVMNWITTIFENNQNDTSIQNCQKLPHIYIYGHSLGTAIAIDLAQELNNKAKGTIQGVILDSPFTTLFQAAMAHPIAVPIRVFPFVKNIMKKHFEGFYNSLSKITKIDSHLLILHGTLDSTIPVEQGRLLYQTAKEMQSSTEAKLIEFVEVPLAGHSAVYRSAHWLAAVPRFVTAAERQ